MRDATGKLGQNISYSLGNYVEQEQTSETTYRTDERQTLFGEQAVLCGWCLCTYAGRILRHLCEAGYDPRNAFTLSVSMR